MIPENELMNDLTNILAEIHKFTETNISKPFNELKDTTINYLK
tara:strand:+ start:953 stop:1081 length:129 start_codon:yes stop_codon:yes gene_type:complete